MEAIIEGKIVRFALLGDAIEFDVLVSKTIVHKETFTLGTTVNCVVKPPKLTISDCVIKDGHVIPVPKKLTEPFKTARCLAVGDEVSVEFKKDKNGSWEVSAITHNPHRGQDVNEFLLCLEEEYRRWHLLESNL